MTDSLSCDVLVVGAGAAGMSAASAAAASGANVVLLERYGFLGGLATAARVGTICGLPADADPRMETRGCFPFVRGWLDSLARSSRTECIRLPGELTVLPYDSWAFRRLADDRVAATEGLTPLLHATLVDVNVRGEGDIEARALVWDRLLGLHARSLIDCSGSATAVRLAGGPVTETTPSQAAGVVFSMEGLASGLDELSVRLSVLRRVGRAVDEGNLSKACASASFVPGSTHDQRVDIKLALDPRPVCETWLRMSKLEIEARRAVGELSAFLVAEIAAFRPAHVGRVAAQVGIRADGLVRGRKVLSQDDVLQGTCFDDGVAWGTWPIEEWSASGSPRLSRLRADGCYEIPLRCMQVDGLDDVWVAGRCLAADSRALASARVIGTALQTGWAAGSAAADRALGRPEHETIARLRGESS